MLKELKKSYGLVEGTVYRINKAVLDVYFESQQVDYYNKDLQKFKWPENIEKHAVDQILVYTKKEWNEKDGWMFYFFYDGIFMRFGRRFVAFLKYIEKKGTWFEIDQERTNQNIATGQHLKDYQTAYQIALNHREERQRLEEVNAQVLARYINPIASVDPNFEWNTASFFKKIWIFINNQIKEKIWNRQYRQWQQQQETLRLQVEERRRKKAEALAKAEAMKAKVGQQIH